MHKGYVLEDLLGSPEKIKIIRFFINNSEAKYSMRDVARFLRENVSKVRQAMNTLQDARFLLFKKQSNGLVYFLNKSFLLRKELQALVLKASPASFDFIKRALERTKGVKLAVASGVLLGEDSSRADLLIVGDRLNKAKITNLAARIEAEAGREILLAVFDTTEFYYRLNMYYKFVRDILEYRHEKLINKLRMD
jgi:hypothetical protein